MALDKKPETMYDRLIEMLAYAVGPRVREYLRDPNVIEILLNPDGKLWVDKLDEGRIDTGYMVLPAHAEQVIYLVASFTDAICNEDHPIISAELPEDGSRFQGMLPKIVAAPTFAIRKKALKIFSLDDYVAAGIMSFKQKAIIVDAVWQKKNILVVGGTGSGKTTLVNGILQEIAKTGDRIILIEDTIELQCTALDCVPMRTRDNVANMNDLLRSAMRLRPDRIIIGEIRGKEALDFLKSLNTGHPGGCSTVHANSALAGLSRLEALILENVGLLHPQRELIGEAVDLVIFIERCASGRQIKEIRSVKEYRDGNYVTELVG